MRQYKFVSLKLSWALGTSDKSQMQSLTASVLNFTKVSLGWMLIYDWTYLDNTTLNHIAYIKCLSVTMYFILIMH